MGEKQQPSRQRICELMVCGQCGGQLVDRVVEPYQPPRIVCANDPGHQGWISASTVEIRLAERGMQETEIRMTYPELFPRNDPPRKLEDLYD